jgi:hypothetical protein
VLPPEEPYSDRYRRVERLRAEGALRNDDVSLLTVKIVEPAVLNGSARSAEHAGLR